MPRKKLIWAWLRARRVVLGCMAAVFACFFAVYAVYGYGWGVAGYAALMALAAAAAFAVWDFGRFAAKYAALGEIAGRFPTSALPPAEDLVEEQYAEIITALEAERAALEWDGQNTRRDAEEYYTLWAHQIKTPMAAMGLLLGRAAGEMPPQIHADMEQELFRIGQYVEMVLQYQRLSSLQSDLVLKPQDLAALAKKAAKACAPLFIYKGLGFNADKVQGTAVTDEKWFCFVLEQLYTNAVKYTQTGVVRVYSEAPHTLIIEDPGCGIPAEDLPRVFERGFTGAAGRTERSSTGIGLYLCRQVLGRLGFGIAIESEQGKGTKVILDLQQDALDVE